MNEKKMKNYSVRMPEDMHDRFEEIADEDYRTFSGMIIKLVGEYIKEYDERKNQ